jgi:hypothetical protein
MAHSTRGRVTEGRLELMKHKLFAVLVVSVLMFSVIGVALADVCPRCHGTGKIPSQVVCPTCGGSNPASPDIVRKSYLPGDASVGAHKAVTITGIFHNNGQTSVTATVLGTVKTSQTQTYTNMTTWTFPPGEDTTVTVRIDGVEKQPYYAYFIEIQGYGTNPNCPTCGGTGYITESITCPDCLGTGVVNGLVGGIGADVIGPIAGVVAVGAVAGVGFFVLKKRRVTEQSLRRKAGFEFQAWVVKKLQANPASQKDSYLGIDAYTTDGYPLQIRQEDDVGKRAIDSFAAALARSKTRSGTIVAFGFGKDSFEGVMKARLNYRLEIKTVTVRELLTGRERTL